MSDPLKALEKYIDTHHRVNYSEAETEDLVIEAVNEIDRLRKIEKLAEELDMLMDGCIMDDDIAATINGIRHLLEQREEPCDASTQ